MKTVQHIFSVFIISLSFAFFSCTEELPDVTGKNHIYKLEPVSNQDIDGHMKIRERFDGSTQLELALNNTDPNQTYSAYIHFNNALEGGGVALTLTPVDGHSSSSVTEIRNLDSGTSISYAELLQFDGHVNIQFGDEPGITVARADIGLNALTGRFQQFILYEGDVEGVQGLLTVEERVSGFSLITVQVEGAVPGKLHPVTLNFGSIYQQTGIARTLNPVEGSSGIGQTNVDRFDGDLVVRYDALVNFKGFARIHLGDGPEMNTVLAQGNIAYVEN